MRTVVLAVIAASIAVSLSGCRIVGSADVKTASINPKIYVESYPSGETLVWVALLHGFGDALQLTGGDTITVSRNGGTPVAMTFKNDMFLTPAYVANLSGVSSGDELVVALTRTGHADAPDTRIVIPPGFTMSSPTSGTTYAYGDAIHVAWTPGPGSDSVVVRAEIQDCTQASSSEVADGNALFDYPRIAPASDGSMDVAFPVSSGNGTCHVHVVAGLDPGAITLDPAFGYLSSNSAAVRVATPATVTFAP